MKILAISDMHKGNQVVSELIKTHRPLITFCAHPHQSPGREWVGNSLVVNPGALKYGFYALVDTVEGQAEFKKL